MVSDKSFHSLIVSIHAPVKGATVYLFHVSISFRVSIHAPVKGATFDGEDHWLTAQVSIHAPVKGATKWKKGRKYLALSFNSRSREGSDPIGYFFQKPCISFNSRSREGSDKAGIPYIADKAVSIHAPVKGAT